MFDPPVRHLPVSPHFLPPFLSLPLQSTSFTSLPFTHTHIRRMGGKKARGLSGMGMRSGRLGGDLPLTVARRPPGWVGRAHNRVATKKTKMWSRSGWWRGYLRTQLWWGLFHALECVSMDQILKHNASSQRLFSPVIHWSAALCGKLFIFIRFSNSLLY